MNATDTAPTPAEPKASPLLDKLRSALEARTAVIKERWQDVPAESEQDRHNRMMNDPECWSQL